MKDKNTSGTIRLDHGTIVYELPGDGWRLKLSDVRLIGEYTNSNGPFLDDYFFVFLTAAESGWHQASFYADGRDSFLKALSEALRVPIETGLCNSVEFKTRILWPSDLNGKPLMKVVPKPTRCARLWTKITGVQDIELSDTARAVFKNEEAEHVPPGGRGEAPRP